jgi:hypothetical protein
MHIARRMAERAAKVTQGSHYHARRTPEHIPQSRGHGTGRHETMADDGADDDKERERDP